MPHREDADALKEKYYHSMGAILTEEGDLEEAVVFFQKAIDIRETPYAWYGLARTLYAAGDVAGAVGAMSRAIKLAPGAADYYHERAAFLEALGRPDLAAGDVAKAVSLDRNYERVDEIRWAARVVEGSFFPPVPFVEDAARIRSGGLRRLLEGEGDADVFRKPSCPVLCCPAYCCHFTGRLLLHGVTIGPWKLQGLRGHFREKGLREEDLLDVFPVAEAGHAESLFPPQDVMKRGGVASVTFPRQGTSPLGRDLAGDIPKGKDYRTLMWIGEDARPCVFLSGGRCSLYDVGDEASLDPCASFLCMTGFVFVVLRSLGLMDSEAMGARSMAELNGIAVEALIILARDVYGSDEALASSKTLADELQTAVEGDLAGDDVLRDAAMERYRLLKTRHEDLIGELAASAGKRIARLFAGGVG
ncbi:MAG TPA: tetratricopeptide repeat protein [Syntrophorhabdaceae bacterium]|nr:tetratricopeptide repeat protein [Syntrophorhabdaceae bacterium]